MFGEGRRWIAPGFQFERFLGEWRPDVLENLAAPAGKQLVFYYARLWDLRE